MRLAQLIYRTLSLAVIHFLAQYLLLIVILRYLKLKKKCSEFVTLCVCQTP